MHCTLMHCYFEGLHKGASIGHALSHRPRFRSRSRGGVFLRGDLPGEAQGSLGEDEGGGGGAPEGGGKETRR